MSLPTSYLTSIKNLPAFLEAIKSAQAPEKFTQSFLESLEFKSSADRLFIPMLKMLGLLDDAARPTDLYFRFLDQTQSASVLAEGIREAYDDLFRVNINANALSKQDVINKFKTLSQGKVNENVLDRMANTFTALVKHADFAAASEERGDAPGDAKDEPEGGKVSREQAKDMPAAGIKIGGLVYNIQLILPESRDAAVYDALFQSLRRHLG
jgi:hypothetical protein